ncbi:hypothetical protein [Acidiplasma aeolicum]|uniref:Nucleotide-diphospho-sugar transferase domain-containing protein n=2 Tax=Acidiplasma aeolicum TaxID=507754 RepID=A0A0Q0RZG7_9ARCH|nr:hypothetical protein [Acidiplasma aeolicum]KQB35984.1 hypothetical protein AOG54_08180 [Acidiplasma aeolicum]
MGKLVFVHIVEKGDLEFKSILLCSSIRKYGGIYKDSLIYAITPRKDKEVSCQTKEIYKKLNVKYIYKSLNIKWYDQPYLNSIYGAAFIEKYYLNSDVSFVYVDADTFFIKQPDKLDLEKNKVQIATTPIDSIKAEIANSDINDISEYWKHVYKLFNVDINKLWCIKTLHDNKNIVAYFNIGIISVKPSLQIFQECLEKIEMAYNDPYFSGLPKGSLERFYLDQVFTSAAVVKHPRDKILLLDSNYNYSLPVMKHIDQKKFKTIVHIHYHHMFFYRRTLKIFQENVDIYNFLKLYVPFQLDKKIRTILFIKSHIPIKIKNYLRETSLMKYINKVLNKVGINVG